MGLAVGIQVTSSISIDESELEFDFIRTSGPGGQNVNKVASGVQLRFDVRTSPSLPEDVRQRLESLAGKRLTVDGILVIDARRFRTQERNRQDAVERFVNLVSKAAEVPTPRKKTKPTQASKMRRLDEKRKRGEIKRMRKGVGEE